MQKFYAASGITAGNLSQILMTALIITACLWGALIIFGMIKSMTHDDNLSIDRVLSQSGRVLVLVSCLLFLNLLFT
jgi:hypothetical protein